MEPCFEFSLQVNHWTRWSCQIVDDGTCYIGRKADGNSILTSCHVNTDSFLHKGYPMLKRLLAVCDVLAAVFTPHLCFVPQISSTRECPQFDYFAFFWATKPCSVGITVAKLFCDMKWRRRPRVISSVVSPLCEHGGKAMPGEPNKKSIKTKSLPHSCHTRSPWVR